ncbi:MAG: hypothetical protein AAF183_17885 [Pseudomonadota bacterium]
MRWNGLYGLLLVALAIPTGNISHAQTSVNASPPEISGAIYSQEWKGERTPGTSFVTLLDLRNVNSNRVNPNPRAPETPMFLGYFCGKLNGPGPDLEFRIVYANQQPENTIVLHPDNRERCLFLDLRPGSQLVVRQQYNGSNWEAKLDILPY